MPEMRISAGPCVFDHETDECREQAVPARLAEATALSTGWVLASLAAIALGIWAIYHFGPDFRRYIKAEIM